MTTDLIHAPWTAAQVTALNAFQHHGRMHPFTCRAEHASGQSPVLVATNGGWVCPDPQCVYRQDWAHAFMAEPAGLAVGLGVSATPSHTDQDAELERLRTENERMRHELEVMYGGAFDSLDTPPPADRAAVLRDLIHKAEEWDGHITVQELRRLADEAQQQPALRPDFTSPIAGRVEVRDPCPWCGDRQLIPRHQMTEHVARLHPDVRTVSPYATGGMLTADQGEGLSAAWGHGEAPQPEPPVHGESVAHLAGYPGKGQSASRREIVHGCPPDGSGLTLCCGRTPFELPLGDRISSEARVTCAGPAVDARQDGAQDRG